MNGDQSKPKPNQRRPRLRNDLRLERRQRGLSRKQVAGIVGISVDSIDSYERGRRLPNLITALKLQILFRSQLASFYEGLYAQLTAETRAAEEGVRTRRSEVAR